MIDIIVIVLLAVILAFQIAVIIINEDRLKEKTDAKEIVKAVELLDLHPEDKLLVSTEKTISSDDADRMREQFTLMLSSDYRVGIVSNLNPKFFIVRGYKNQKVEIEK